MKRNLSLNKFYHTQDLLINKSQSITKELNKILLSDYAQKREQSAGRGTRRFALKNWRDK
ncbi:MAG: hypothetical protein LUG13_01635 [Oscillospiraceae bacterium]|nr:hypothetical protein [Oscillospiraceae bacterium]